VKPFLQEAWDSWEADTLTLAELAPKYSELMDRFKHWVRAQFEVPANMFGFLQDSPENPKVSREHFLHTVANLGFDGTFQESVEVFECCVIKQQHPFCLLLAPWSLVDGKQRWCFAHGVLPNCRREFIPRIIFTTE